MAYSCSFHQTLSASRCDKLCFLATGYAFFRRQVILLVTQGQDAKGRPIEILWWKQMHVKEARWLDLTIIRVLRPKPRQGIPNK